MKQSWKPGTVLYPLPAVLVSCGSVEHPNLFTVAWTGIVCSDPAMTYISVRPSRYSYGLIEASGEFVLNLTTEALAFATDYCGVVSGRDTDKFAHLGLTAAPSTVVSAPSLAESPVNIECRVREKKHLGTHDMFLADIVAVQADDAYYDETGRFCFDRAHPICYSHGQYYTLGKRLGKFGYSIQKASPKPARR